VDYKPKPSPPANLVPIGECPAWLEKKPIWVLAAVLCGICFLAVILSIPRALKNEGSGSGRGAKEIPHAKEIPYREEFRRTVIGKTFDEVIAAIGRPDDTQQLGNFAAFWYYRRAARDEVTGKVGSAQLVFEAPGVVKDVNFF
jgi:hypothetical protein